jgi:hypothetical protein
VRNLQIPIFIEQALIGKVKMRIIDGDIKADDPSMKVLRKIPSLLTIFILVSLLAAACSSKGDGVETLESSHSIDPLFRSFYEKLGGEDRMGPAISPAFESGGVLYQYTLAGLMKYEAVQAADQRFQLAALGLEMGIYELPQPEKEIEGQRVVAGHPIYRKFESLFDQLGGVNIVGEPLTGVHENVQKQRYEQYFKNLGFYWIDGAPEDEVHLLAYGAWKCGYSCRRSTPGNSAVLLPTRTAAPFVKTASKYGLSFTGFAISEPFVGTDGNLEQIYENLVLFANPEYPDQVNMRPIAYILDVPLDDPRAPSADANMHFFPVEEGLGYNIPSEFMDFISRRGGFEISGPPVSQLNRTDDGALRQCFRNLCLDLLPDADDQFEVQAVPLGYTYKKLFYKPMGSSDTLLSEAEVSLQVWENYPMIAPEQEQEIGVALFAGGEPLANVSPELVVTLPDGTTESYHLPQTGEDGRTQLRLESISAENGTLVPYQVCVDTPEGPRFCVIDSYLIWEADYVTVKTPQPPQYQTHIPLILRSFTIYVPALVENLQDIFLPVVVR